MERLQELALKYPLDFVADFFELLVVGFGLFKYNKDLKWEMKLLIGYFLGNSIRDLISLYYAYFKWTNFYLYNIYSFFEILFIVLIYLAVFQSNTQKRIVIFVGVLCLVLNLVFFSIDSLSAFDFTAFRLLSIFLVLMYFINLLSEMRVKFITKHSMFWVSSGLLIYTSGTLLTFLFIEFLYKTERETRNFFIDFTQVLYILFCIFSSIGLWFSKYDKENYIE